MLTWFRGVFALVMDWIRGPSGGFERVPIP